MAVRWGIDNKVLLLVNPSSKSITCFVGACKSHKDSLDGCKLGDSVWRCVLPLLIGKCQELPAATAPASAINACPTVVPQLLVLGPKTGGDG